MSAASTVRLREVLGGAPEEARFWLPLVRRAAIAAIADDLAQRLDQTTGRWPVSNGEVSLVDNGPYRAAELSTGVGLDRLRPTVSAELRATPAVDRRRIEAALNAGMKPPDHQSWGNRLYRHVDALLTELVGNPAARERLRQPIVPELWRATADRLAVRVATAGPPATVEAERATHALCLLAAELRVTRAGRLSAVLGHYADDSVGLLGSRGGLVRLVERVGPAGVSEPLPPAAPALRSFQLTPAPTPWLTAMNRSVADVFAGRGAVSRIVDPNRPLPGPMPGGLDRRAFDDTRDQALRQYDLTILAFQLMSSAEQLIRAWAHSSGRPVLHLPSGRPMGVLKLTGGWAAADRLQPFLRDLFGPLRSNLRSKLAHGGLLSVHAERQHAAQRAVAEQTRRRPPAPGLDLLSVENWCGHGLELIRAIGREIGKTGVKLTPADFAWSTAMRPSTADIAADLAVAKRPMTRADLHRWERSIDLLTALVPGLNRFVIVGLIGRTDRQIPNSVDRYLAGLLAFEALYRLVAQMWGARILQLLTFGTAEYEVQYVMLDDRGLLADPILDRVVEGLPPGERAAASHCLLSTAACRDAVVHGAILDFGGDRAIVMNHWLVQAVQALAESALNLMTRERAYYRSRDPARPPGVTADADWASAAAEQWADVARVVRKRQG